MIPNKPYIWVEISADRGITLYVRFDCGPTRTILRSLVFPSTDEDRLVLEFPIVDCEASTGSVEYVAESYDETIHTKITVKITDLGVLKGMCTVKPLAEYFSAVSSMPDMLYKPFVWMQFINASTCRIHFLVRLAAKEILHFNSDSDPDPHTDDGKLFLPCSVSEDGSDAEEYDVETTYDIDDTVYEDVTVDIITEVEKKGSGTGHHSEGDTSGGD